MDTMRILLTLVCLNIFLFCEGKSITQSECSRTCKPDLENGNYKQQRNGGIVYSCDRPYVSNIPGLQTMRFECKFVPEFGCWELKAANSRFNNPWGPIYLRNITCQPNTECSNPPLPAHVVRDRTVQYEKEVAIQGVVQPRDKFYSGDTFEYKCQDGFSVVEKSISYDYYNYEEEAEADETMSMTITCDLSGRWNGKEDYELEFEKCEAIICDARRFSDMRNGNITDYKPSYNFREEMRLVCNEGYKPKNGISVVTCTTNSSFDQLILPSFGCEPITCLEPVNPKNGQMRLQGVYVGDKATFECNSGYNLIGSAEWTCQLNGRWDATCIRCESQDSRSHCPAPCIPLGADVVSVEDTFSVGSVLEFVCKSGGQYYSGSKERTCLQNGKWSGTPIDCTGDSLYDENVGVTLLKALEKQVPDNSSAENDNEIMSKTINKGQVGGVDVYFLVDVSGSIDQKKFNATKRFINATLPMLGINSDERTGTRIVLYYFASKSLKLADKSHFDIHQYESYKDAQSLIFTNETLEDIRKKIDSGSGTAIAAALKDIITDLETKVKMVSRQLYRQAQQVIILLSDGMFTTDGSPKENANILKDELGVEIYSIFVGDAAKENFGYQTMKEIASKIENEEHFFAIQDNDDNFNDVLSKMINGVDNIQCGMTQERLTNLRNNESRYEHDANEHAWPWMADLRTNMESKCGGSLIGERWVLTAAHCLEENIISMVHLQKLKQKQVQGIIAIPVAESDCKVHPKYNSSSIPEFKYDIALIKLQQSVVYTPILLPVCLWNETIKNTSNKNVDDYYKKGIHGVATGWGLRSSRKDDKPEVLKQMQMQVQSPEDCTKDLTDKEKRGVDNELMFCAGGQEMVDGVLKYIDTCGGDSGGPFLVEHPLIENKYIQTGIVSFGYGCKQPGKYGFYTKLTEELLEWIKKTMNES